MKSGQRGRKASDTSARTPRAIHHERRFAPKNANGARVGFRKTRTDRGRQTQPSAMNAISQIPGLPPAMTTTVVGHQRQNRIAGQPTGAGRSQTTAAIVIPSGIA